MICSTHQTWNVNQQKVLKKVAEDHRAHKTLQNNKPNASMWLTIIGSNSFFTTYAISSNHGLVSFI